MGGHYLIDMQTVLLILLPYKSNDLSNNYKLAVMADVKLHDIPSTMENSVINLINAGANIITIHCASNFRPKNDSVLKYLAGVTMLTSFTDLEVKWIYDKRTEEIVRDFSDIALMNHYAYSPREVPVTSPAPLGPFRLGIDILVEIGPVADGLSFHEH